ncbi:sodium-coupled monocarboxylate transporter 1-like [Uranotaenia lowii]|uniref:sodium-coupled monocarboxylate transporter 1-like n=1 Tax=Uranotaenia lowii TaxID=190385 RepID=UPI0024799E69|nr:sodium-coupled monocarboxylate transporter 1-like [Uranotaenia lowii]
MLQRQLEQETTVDNLWNYLTFVGFVVISALIPIRKRLCSRKVKTKQDYVFGAGHISTLAMMLSITRGTLGVISVLGYPSEFFYRGTGMWETLYGMMTAYPIVCFVFIPVYFDLGITSVYQYLELRFDSRLVRCLASGTYIMRTLLSLGVTIYTPTVALNSIIGVPYWASLLCITLISIFFNALGGMKAAVAADVIQSLSMTGMLVGIVIYCTVITDGGFKRVIEIGVENGRMNFFNFAADLHIRVTTTSAWLGELFMSLSLLGCQQNFVQRYLSMPSLAKIRKTMLINIPLVAVLFSLPWLVGMGIYAVYYNCDPLKVGLISKIDQILPFFVVDYFSSAPGAWGLFVGTLFNGALTLNISNINSLATVTWEDFLSLIPGWKTSDSFQLTVIKVVGSFYAVLIMGMAFLVGLFSGVIESSVLVISATSGPLLGVFILAMFVPFANWKGAALGMAVSHILTLWIVIGRMMYAGFFDSLDFCSLFLICLLNA